MQSKKLVIKNLVKIYRGSGTQGAAVHAVDDISLEIKPGEFVTLLGPSGCGKTTALRMIVGFEKPTAGEIILGDRLINNVAPDKRDTAMVFQTYALFPNYNVWDNIAYGLKIRKRPAEEIQERVSKIISLVGLEGLERRQTNQLSGGQQQRVALARALVLEPSILLFDEPLSNLDAKLRLQMRTEIRKLQQEMGITAVYVTHDQAEAMSMSDRIVILKDGKIAQIGTPTEVYYHPASEFVANFIGTANFLNATVETINENGTMDVNVLGKVLKGVVGGEHEKGDLCRLVVRPEACVLDDHGLFEAAVQLSVFMGSYQYYEVMINDQLFIIHENNPQGRRQYKKNDSVFVTFNTRDAHVL